MIDAALDEASKRKDEIDDLFKNKGAPRGDDAFTNLRRGVAALSVISPEVNQTLNALLLNIEEYVGEQEIETCQSQTERGEVVRRFHGSGQRRVQTLLTVDGADHRFDPGGAASM